jgi:hypothetical protein
VPGERAGGTLISMILEATTAVEREINPWLAAEARFDQAATKLGWTGYPSANIRGRPDDFLDVFGDGQRPGH